MDGLCSLRVWMDYCIEVRGKKGLSILPAFSNGLELTHSVSYTITFYLPLVVCSNWSLKDVHHDYLLSPPPFTLEAETEAAAEDVVERTMAVTTVTKSAFLLTITVYTVKNLSIAIFSCHDFEKYYVV